MLILPLHPPVPIARAIATVDVLSRGRVSVGLGVGWMREEFEAVGQSFHDRGRQADEMIAVLDRLPEMGFEPKPVSGRGRRS